ncbi:uncharacterized protein LOC119629987 isoform X2 [Bombyx mori]|uniref:Uncharacterized protein n=1 Tax=Bombyx mori TaxID=7091 RepID=A0A8R2M3Z3_BOMMO|nr:uncharacterized protein LOC119629987 isoform X2 [Bombyx mori]
MGSNNEASLAAESDLFREYYIENDYFLSAEGVLKILSAIVCIVSSVLFLVGSSCTAAPGLAAGAAGGALVGGLVMALMYVGVLMNLPLHGAQDILVSGVIGVLLLVAGALSFTICDMRQPVDYVPGPLAVVNAGMVTASTVKTYVSVVGWHPAPPAPSTHPPAHELDV